MDYVNPPIGRGRRPTAPVAPLLAVPTTAGTGSESSPVAIFDLPEQRTKTGIAAPELRPRVAFVDHDLTRTVPPPVAAASGIDVVCHALESFVARPFEARPAPADPAGRPLYQGANPISAVWARRALELCARSLERAVADPEDDAARAEVMLASTLAGMGFAAAGSHLPHACSYPVASLRHPPAPDGYPPDRPFIPHGHTVVPCAISGLRHTFPGAPERHREAARLLDGARAREELGPDALAAGLRGLAERLALPTRLSTFGYGTEDLPALVAGAARQQRLLAVAPLEVTDELLRTVFEEAM
jgi:hydroxyacid-oxoacid transhydrogenase